MEIGILFLVAGLCGIIGAAIGSPANKAGSGFILGLLFGPLGLIIIAILARVSPPPLADPPPEAKAKGAMSLEEFRQGLYAKDYANKSLSREDIKKKYELYLSTLAPATEVTKETPGPITQDDVKTRLSRLDDLLAEGTITETECAQQRKRILSQI